ncbi:MAG: amino acid ABC transporter permease [Bacillota bacterium]|nr:amino acid ABC transporter permease [Bacillota bacterium]NLD12293.1 amino acid ABC transporter permease [Bacillota bacterium]HAV20823.1 nickel transporter [Bacillota bacterium]HOB89074.1 amino acid ABC transporter permease [Bacillota bacterium]HOJ58112.1 amino acid ABC transporter permease [Bacillota bacterium]
MPALLLGARLTVELATIAVAIGLVIGSFVGIGRVSANRIIRLVTGVYVDFIRGTPLLVQLFLVYFGLPSILGRPIPPFVAAITAMGINSGAYVAEIVRAGIQSVDRGQTEAGRSIGLTYSQTMRYIIFPQAFRRIIPPLGNEFIAMLKDSSLVSVIALEELLRKGQVVITRTFRPFEVYMVVALIYLVMTLAISRLVAWSEKRLKVVD